MLVSWITPACQQGDELRETIASAKAAQGSLDVEYIVVDDQSTDGCCHGLDKDVTVIRSEHREGVSASRRLGYHFAQGDIIFWSDPHCRFPKGSMELLVERAIKEDAIIEPRIQSHPGHHQERFGGVLKAGERGLMVMRQMRHAARFPCLDGTIYVMKRSIYENLGGWPKLPGIWSCSEQSLSMMSYYAGVPIRVDDKYICTHKYKKSFSFSISRSDPAMNGYYFHKMFFPRTFECMWLPLLKKKWGMRPIYVASFESSDFKEQAALLESIRVKTEEDFFSEVLRMPFPDSVKFTLPNGVSMAEIPKTESQYIKQQAPRSKAKEYTGPHHRIWASIKWLNDIHPGGGIKDRRVLDVGTRDGYGTYQISIRKPKLVMGIELIPDSANFGASLGRPVVQGDMRYINSSDNSWDIVTCLHAIEHCPDPKKAIKEMMRVLKPGGWLFIVVPKESKPTGYAHHYIAFNRYRSLRDYVLQEPMVKKDSAIGKSSKTKDGKWEIRLMVQKIV